MNYVHVVNGVVQSGPGNIPRSWTLLDGRSVSGFDLRPDLWAAEGWLPIVEQRATFDPATQQLGAPVYTVGATEVTATYSAVPRPVTAINGYVIRAKATQAIVDNIAFAATVAANRQRIIDATAGATTGTTATVTTVAQAQAAIRSIASTLVTTLNAELAIADQAAALSQQNVALLRLMLGELGSTEGT